MITESINFSLVHHNTFGVDVCTALFIEYDTVAELQSMISHGKIKQPFIHVGGGSNLLFLGDFNGTVLHSRIKSIEVVEETSDTITLKVGSGVVWDDFVAHSVEQGWYGAENLSHIPGEVGASAVQNIGAYGVEAKDIITEVHAVDIQGETYCFSNADCNFAYRYSIFKEVSMRHIIVTHVCFQLSKIEVFKLDYGAVRKELETYPAITLAAVREVVMKIRNQKLPDPKVLGNAGSFFMNPIVDESVFLVIQKAYPDMPYYNVGNGKIKIPAGWLIEQSGWKGKVLGRAGVYEKQALVLVNRGNATGKDIIALSDAVRASVYEKFGIHIHPEVTVIGHAD